MDSNANPPPGPETAYLVSRSFIWIRKRQAVFKAEHIVGKIPFLVFWTLNSISLQNYPPHPNSTRNSIFLAILVKYYVFHKMTIRAINKAISAILYIQKWHQFQVSKKMKIRSFLVIFLNFGPFRPKLAKMRHLDHFFTPVSGIARAPF